MRDGVVVATTVSGLLEALRAARAGRLMGPRRTVRLAAFLRAAPGDGNARVGQSVHGSSRSMTWVMGRRSGRRLSDPRTARSTPSPRRPRSGSAFQPHALGASEGTPGEAQRNPRRGRRRRAVRAVANRASGAALRPACVCGARHLRSRAAASIVASAAMCVSGQTEPAHAPSLASSEPSGSRRPTDVIGNRCSDVAPGEGRVHRPVRRRRSDEFHKEPPCKSSTSQ